MFQRSALCFRAAVSASAVSLILASSGRAQDVYINCGGPQFVDDRGRIREGDTLETPHPLLTSPNLFVGGLDPNPVILELTDLKSDSLVAKGGFPLEVFLRERSNDGLVEYTGPVAFGDYEVTLLWMEVCIGCNTGCDPFIPDPTKSPGSCRVQNVFVNGKPFLERFSIDLAAVETAGVDPSRPWGVGTARSLQREGVDFVQVTLQDLRPEKLTENASLNALCIRRVDRVKNTEFVRGDANVDGQVDIDDGVAIFRTVADGVSGNCDKTADVDDSGAVGPEDVAFLFEFLFRGGGAPSLPFPDLGSDPTPDDGLECTDYLPGPPSPKLGAFTFGFEACPPVFSGQPGEVVTFDVFATLTTDENPSVDQGAEGFSVSLGVDGAVRITNVAVEGTVSDQGANPPGLVEDGIVERQFTSGAGNVGLVSVVRLSTARPVSVTLPPLGTVRILRLTAEVTVSENGVATGQIFYIDDRKATGHAFPTQNLVRFQDTNQVPALAGGCIITAEPEDPDPDPDPREVRSTDIYINCGGTEFVDVAGRLWSGDTLEDPSPFLSTRNAFVGGCDPDDEGQVERVDLTADALIAGRQYPAEIFCPERANDGALEYRVAVERGTYEVVLFFMELCCSEGCEDIEDPASSAGPCRVFDVLLNGELVADQFSQVVTASRVAGTVVAGEGSYFVPITAVGTAMDVEEVVVTLADLGRGNPPGDVPIKDVCIRRLPQVEAIGNADFDARVALTQGVDAQPTAVQNAARDSLSQDVPDLSVTYDRTIGAARVVYNRTGFLTEPRPGAAPEDVALDYVTSQRSLLGLA